MEVFGTIAERYRDFAGYAEGDSPCFADWAARVAVDPEVHTWLAELPVRDQQPNLVFAAARWHGAPAPGDYAGFKAVLRDRREAVRATIAARSTQTNEAGRLATLVPAFARVPGPLALVELGASAGLCLFPDRYDYTWPPVGELRGSGGPVLTATASGPLPVPPGPVEIAWRGGCDLNPLDVTDADQMAWLETLVWPEHDDRRALLARAVELAAADPPHVVAGDLFDALPGLLASAGAHGTPVVFHSAVAAYLEEPAREELHRTMTGLVARGECRWVSNEAPGVLPAVSRDLEVPAGRFVLALDGDPVAFAHGHGRALTWL